MIDAIDEFGFAATQQKRMGCWDQQKELLTEEQHTQGGAGTSDRLPDSKGRGRGLVADRILFCRLHCFDPLTTLSEAKTCTQLSSAKFTLSLLK